MATIDEDEWITRTAFHEKITKNEWILNRLKATANLHELPTLRKSQKSIKKTFRRIQYENNKR